MSGGRIVGPAGPADYGLLILLAAIWGSSFLFIKISVHAVPPATMTAARLAIAASALLGVMVLARQSFPRSPAIWGLICLTAVIGNALPFTLISWGQVEVDAGLAAILMAVMPLATVLLAHVFTTDEKLSAGKAVGVLLGLAGLIVLMGPEKLLHLGGETVRQLAIAGAALCYGINALITKSLMHLPRRTLAAAVMLTSAALMLPVSLLLDQPWRLEPDVGSVWAVVALGFVHTATATLIMFALVSRQGASFFSQINFLVPLFGVAWAALFLSEQISADALMALGLILTGIALARGREVPRARAHSRTPSR